MLTGAISKEAQGRLLALGFAALLTGFLFVAVRRGRITPMKADRPYLRFKEPAAYWLHIGAYALITGILVAAAVLKMRLILLAAGTLLTYGALNAVRIGKVKPSIYDRIYTRSEDPGTFWFHVAVEAAVGSTLAAAGVM